MPVINNRPPVVVGPIVVNLTEDTFVVPLSENTNTFDPDLVDLVRATGLPADLPPGITYDPQFHQFIIDSFHPAFQSLQQGQVTQIIVNFFVTDGFAQVPQSLILTMTGVNDAAVITGQSSAALTEDAVTSASGSLTVVDVDSGEAAFQPITALAGIYGALSLSAGGQWTYVLNNASAAVQALTAAQTVAEQFTVYSVDGTAQVISLTVTGADETVLTGTAMADVLTGTAASELLIGLGGRDLLTGNGGDDTLDGGAGADSLSGGDGNDVILFDASDRIQSGGAGIDTLNVARSVTVNLAAADQISGDSGLATGFENVDATFASAAVVLTGSDGANILAGGAAGDRLTGGLGTDVLYGNGGADRFIFRALADSQGITRDEIGDFTHGQDRIDLSAIDAVTGGRDNAFVFIGGAAFTHAGQVRYDAVAGVVEACVTADGVAAFAVDIGAGQTLTASDFVL